MIGTALLLTGLQKAYSGPGSAMAAGGLDVSPLRAAYPHLSTILAAARRAHLPILHFREISLAAGISDSAAWRKYRERAGAGMPISPSDPRGLEFLDDFAPAPGELVIDRFRPSGLQDTRADVLLRSAGIRNVIIAGAETHRSILATAVQAVGLDYLFIVPFEATASASPEMHDAAISILDAWVELLPVSEVVARLAVDRSSAALIPEVKNADHLG
jgi:ureidoacrylate peracid hydrolase